MDLQQLKRDIYDHRYPEKQYQAADQLRFAKGDPETISILFSACYEAKDPKLQQAAVRSLGVLAPDRAWETFMKSTHHREPERRRRAYYHLGTLGNPRSIDVVLGGFRDPEETVRRAAAVSAGRLGSDYRAIDALQGLIDGFESDSVQTAAKRSIEFIQKRLNSRRTGEYRSVDGPDRSFDRPGFNSFNNDHKRKFPGKPNTPRYTPKGF